MPLLISVPHWHLWAAAASAVIAVRSNGLEGATPYAAYLWDDEGGGDEGDAECRVVGHLNGAHWRAWVDEPASSDGPELRNSRQAHFRRSLTGMSSGEAVEVEAVAEAEAEARAPRHVAPAAPAAPAAPVALRPRLGLLGCAGGGCGLRLGLDFRRARISVILPIHNGEKWMDGCMNALLAQTILQADATSAVASASTTSSSAEPQAAGSSPLPLLEVSAYDDGSSDATWPMLLQWAPKLRAAGLLVALGRSGRSFGGGCGFAKNRAVEQSTGEWLCFQDVDDLSLPARLHAQLAAASEPGNGDCLVGSRVVREPEGSTARYVAWANGMSAEELELHRFRECTLLMPTWFISRAAFERTGPFREEKCEDMLFLQAHVARGGTLHRVDQVLVNYRYHAEAATHAIPRATILRHRAEAIDRAVLTRWPSFTIWGAGRDGRDFFKALSTDSRRKVAAFCDVDAKKGGHRA